jgi:hypothetical protein
MFVAVVGVYGGNAITPNTKMLWGKDTGIEVAPDADAVEKMVSRSNVAVSDTWAVAVTEEFEKITGQKPHPVPAAGFYLGNGDTTVVAKDKKGKWTFTFSPLDFWVGASQHSVAPINEAYLAKYKAENPEKFKKGNAWWKEYKDPIKHNHQMGKGYIGNVSFMIPEFENCPDYRLANDLYHAKLVGTFKNGGKAATLTAQVLRGSKAMTTVVANTGTEPITLMVEVSTGQPYYPLAVSEVKTDGDVMWARRNGKMVDATNEVVCYGALGVRIPDCKYTLSSAGKYAAKTSGITIEPGRSVTVLSGYDTSVVFPKNYFLPKIQAYIRNQTDDPVTPMLKSLRSLTPAAVGEMTKTHLAWWRDFWSKSQIDIPSEPALEAHWYGRLYLLGCQLSEGKYPPGMVGFVDREKRIYFGDDYHLNGNFTAQFRGLGGVNHPEFLRAYADLMSAHMPMFKEAAATIFLHPIMKTAGLPGIHVPNASVPFGSVFGTPYADMSMHHNNADQAIPMIHLWETTRDAKYLKNVIYPYLRETAINWSSECLLPMSTNSHRYEVKSAVGECAKFQTNPSGAMSYILKTFECAVEASKALGVDEDLRKGWQERLDKMSPFPTFTTNGMTCLASAEGGVNAYGGYTYNIFCPAEWCHRESPEAKYFNNLITYEGGMTTNGMWEWRWASVVRSGGSWEELMTAFRWAMAQVQPNYAFKYDVSLNEHPVLDGIVAMLMQTSNGRITLFPNWNMKVDATFNQLSGKDAFLVSARLAGGVISDVQIKSEKGLPCRIQNPWPGRAIKVDANGVTVKMESVTPPANAKGLDGRPAQIFEFKTEAGKTYKINREG